MITEWTYTTLGSFCPFLYGKSLIQTERKNGAIPVISSAGIIGYHNIALVNGSGIVVGRKGTVGSVTLSEQPFWAIDTAFFITDEPQKRDIYFTYYLLKTLNLSKMNSDSAVPGLNRDNAHALFIKIPPLEEQHKISSIFHSLDLRIRLLRETNATLEAITKALFKSWFINFDPVHAKADGHEQEEIDEATAALFPDSFEESELGLVPQGWNINAIYDMGTYINGAAYRAFEPNETQLGLPIIKIAELKGGITAQTRYSAVKMHEKYKINRRDILFSWSGNPDTSIDTFVWTEGSAWLNQHIFRVIPRNEQERSFLLMTLRYLKPMFTEIARNKQTTGLGHVTIADLKRLKLAIPPKPLLDRWDEVVSPLLEQAFIMECQSKILMNLRDTLLPYLISGKFRLPEFDVSHAHKEAEVKCP